MPRLITSGLQVVEAETKTGKWPVMICSAHCNLSALSAHPRRGVLACKVMALQGRVSFPFLDLIDFRFMAL